MTTIPIDEYKNAMREAICPVCVCFATDRQNPNQCAHENSGQCSLFAHLADVVESVSTVQSGSIEPYTAMLRQKVCAHCEHQDEREVCKQRDSREPMPTWCVLDSYFNLIVGAIEEVQKTHGQSAAHNRL